MAGGVVNPFRGVRAARRYAAGRLDVHPEFVRRIRAALGGAPVRRVLDVACGTGLSTRALASLAPRVVGVDAARPMLAEAARSGRSFAAAKAEALPFQPGAFDLVAMGCAYHWCDRAPLLREMQRVLAPGGHLAVYEHYLAGRMEGEPRFRAWHDEFRERFPSPPRHATFDASHAPDLRPVTCERFEHVVPLTREALVSYLTSQSGVLWAIERGAPAAIVETELLASLEPLFGDRRTAAFTYRGEMGVVQKLPSG